MTSSQMLNTRLWQREGAAGVSVYSFASVIERKQGTTPATIPAPLCLDNHGPPGFPE
jgi:hypothetical protein